MSKVSKEMAYKAMQEVGIKGGDEVDLRLDKVLDGSEDAVLAKYLGLSKDNPSPRGRLVDWMVYEVDPTVSANSDNHILGTDLKGDISIGAIGDFIRSTITNVLEVNHNQVLAISWFKDLPEAPYCEIRRVDEGDKIVNLQFWGPTF